MAHDALNAESEKLRALIGSEETDERLRAVEEALQSKFEGIQSLAAQVLGTWQTARAKQMLRGWLESHLHQGPSSSVAVGSRALGQLVEPNDADWLLDLYFSTPDLHVRHSLLLVVEALPARAISERIAKEHGAPDQTRRQAATILANRLRSRGSR